jgi:cytidylate kinase
VRPKGLLITIDGPAGAGKSTVGRRLAGELGYLFLDTGAMYRAVGLAAKRAGVSPEDEASIVALCQTLELNLLPQDKGARVFLNGEEVTSLLRTPEMDRWASAVARIPGVRAWLFKRQRAYGKEGGVVAEGRDMGSVVFPDADLKFFLTASPEERAKRRLRDLLAQGLNVSYEEVLRDLLERDLQDQKRETAPLIIPEGALVVDTSGLGLEDVLKRLLFEIKKFFGPGE